MPPVLRWARVEPNVRSVGMESGLSAEICDAAWLLARQWQLGEFRGEDAGSPVRAYLQMECTPLTRLLPGGLPDTWFTAGASTPVATGQRIDTSVPLETIVERERVRTNPLQQPKLAAEAGLHFLRLLTDAGLGSHRATVTSICPLQPTVNASDVASARFALVMARRVPDGVLLSFVLDVVAN